MSTTRKRTILSAAQKREICEIKEREPNLSNVSLAQRYNIGKSTVTDILSEKERWLAISGDQGSIKKFRGPKWPRLEQALGLWVDNALNTRQDIDGNILKVKAAFFAERFSIEDFHQSEGWLTGFKKRHGLQQFRKQGEASSAPSVESIENDRLALQDFLKSYNPEDIWNADETGLFWKMEPSRRLFIQNRIEAYDNVQDGFVEKLADYNIFEALQNSAEAWSMVSAQTISNCWKKTRILPPSDEIEDDSIFDDYNNTIEDEEVELENLIAFLPEGDHLNAREYINIEDEIAEGALTDDEIIDAILNADKEEEIVVEENELMPIMEKVSLKEAEKAVNNITQFLYEQGSEFGDVNDELKILKGLHKRIKLLIVRNLKQLNLNNFHN
ncbi:unnamed protein product [Rhizophagus irregularis]|nr:unnamed protein product [Rhizophagus irregularis]CAB4433114.1 unnamed protein product [Rhizophagus irregularis]